MSLKIQETAAGYVARLYSGDMTAGEEAALQNWLAADPRHRLAFDTLAAMSDEFAVEAENFHVPEFSEEVKPTVNQWFMEYPLRAMAVAASLIFAVVALLMQSPTAPAHLTLDRVYETAIGVQDTVSLPDGSIVTLNTDTVLEVDFTGPDRVATLLQGEAYFDIAKDKARVFTVHAGSQTITVLGTKFNVQKRGQEYTVAVVEGLVAVHPKGQLFDAPVLEAASEDAAHQGELKGQYRLKAGHVLTYKDKTDLVATAKVEDTTRYSEWSSGIVTFNEVTLEEVVGELGRYSEKKILIVDRDIETMKVSGVFHLRKLDEVILGLEQAFPLQVIMREDAILLSGS